MSKLKHDPLAKITSWIVVVLFAFIVVTCNLSNRVDAFKCDIVHGSDHLPGWSNSKEEAIKRKTYVCDVMLSHYSLDNDQKYNLRPLRGWVESSWRSGLWYLTTTKDTGKDITYRVTIPNKGDKREWKIMNNEQGGYGYVALQYDKDDGQFRDYIDKRPLPDTLFYNVLKKDRLNFKSENIEGRIRLIMLKHK
jgi:hypothetical protein